MNEMTLSARIAQDKIRLSAIPLPGVSDDGMRRLWSVAMTREGTHVTFRLPDPYESNDVPTAFDVLDLVTGACSLIDQADDWCGWQSEYMTAQPGTPEWEERDRIYTEGTFNTWHEINNRLRDFLGHQRHEDYLYSTDRNA